MKKQLVFTLVFVFLIAVISLVSAFTNEIQALIAEYQHKTEFYSVYGTGGTIKGEFFPNILVGKSLPSLVRLGVGDYVIVYPKANMAYPTKILIVPHGASKNQISKFEPNGKLLGVEIKLTFNGTPIDSSFEFFMAIREVR